MNGETEIGKQKQGKEGINIELAWQSSKLYRERDERAENRRRSEVTGLEKKENEKKRPEKEEEASSA